MAYDPEARENSNTAMVIGIVAVVLVVLGALAWYATRPAEQPIVVTQPPVERVIERETVEQPVLVPDAPSTVIVQPGAPAPAAPPASTTTRTEVDIRTSPAAPAPAAPPAGTTTTNNVTVNPPANAAGNTTTTTTTTEGTTAPAPRY